MNRYLYTLLVTLLLPLFLLYLLWRSRKEPAYRQRWGERLAWTKPQRSGGILVHCASMGETLAALPLIRALQQRYPDRLITVTTTTPSGSEQVRQHLGDSVQHCYLPLDLSGFSRRFLKALNPELVILMETELWPNLVHHAQRQGVKLMLANARMSARSARGYLRFPGLVKPLLNGLDAVAMQNEVDGERMMMLGLEPAKITVCGSLKFDIAVSAEAMGETERQRRELLGERSVWCAGSTHPGEFEVMLAAHRRLLALHPDLLLLLVPRHPQQFEAAFALSRAAGFVTARRSEGALSEGTQVVIGDTMGELIQLYGMADVAFVGGSLIPRGGHNPLEPAALAKPILMGPHDFNFAEIGETLVRAGALKRVANEEELAAQVEHLLSLPSQAKATGKLGQRVVEINRGSTQRQCHLAEQLLEAHTAEQALNP
ncbi:lipid IV(A) 3-deoxy-D-manno-octulosonic acid transferase [Ferrimonas marina]|uniref:3-deoxy-D-manno-octulosonic acid transferase n=1 Tax=Ferrimonas marina TaxID=299255 RepID=A0A1M5ZA27_9GAMM|nr:lipid IV(A) 3-deoxy-D-manno-octulosonic acid transferase [Ferrimonas marina]SHI21070.1 3-deoxy-D-manno-octulosonic-acid transferase [Ferrimonas marina]